ncbi:hypothetical protein SAMN05216223_105239 [Actinacidiphila yanglinensis]|uniref:Transmembrane protein n=1 Tax=Actinacidiphila yanglinensis TaxID=310779 RepID=A0A1H6A9Q4_9ACTN|nr:hypothetical protein [Actinacidiphila yanglinensis]SEG44934.1 hypothetical protein SAMN05216223_105239 [Actinacidiphila yanglinensis]
MHMTSAPHLLTEDRPDFEHVLDEALRIVVDGIDGGADEAGGDGRAGASRGSGGDGAAGSPLNIEQLRTIALAAAESIGARVAEEYDAYRQVRAESRDAARESAQARDNRAFSYAAMGVADSAGSGAGLFAVMAVLTPLLAGAAALIFLLIGYALQAVSPEPGIASPLRTAGWFFAAVAAAAIVLGGIGLLLTALRAGSTAVHDGPTSLPPEVAHAREVWRRALLDRGMLPFLDDVVAGRVAVPQPPAAPASGPRMPRLGYSRPDFSSPQDPQSTAPRFASPDFSSPDFGGPDHRPD